MKKKEVHSPFFAVAKNRCLEIQREPIVTDREKAIIYAIKT